MSIKKYDEGILFNFSKGTVKKVRTSVAGGGFSNRFNYDHNSESFKPMLCDIKPKVSLKIFRAHSVILFHILQVESLDKVEIETYMEWTYNGQNGDIQSFIVDFSVLMEIRQRLDFLYEQLNISKYKIKYNNGCLTKFKNK